MYGVLIGAVLNTILDPVYIFIFHWGVKGAAIATVTSQLISAAVLAWYFIRKGSIRLKLSKMKNRSACGRTNRYSGNVFRCDTISCLPDADCHE